MSRARVLANFVGGTSTISGAPTFTGTVTGAGGGKVLQAVHTLYDTEESISGQANTVKASGLIGTITPSDTSSKILIMYGITTSNNKTGASYGEHHTIYHDIGQTGSYTALTTRHFGARFGQYGSYQMNTIGGHLLHTPSTTSAINYNVQFGYTANWDYVKYINRGGSSESGVDGQSYITLLELSG
tara:strand:- start:1705 stop:2262 length:558 start_codon:yes stop_codon:yes gene_type:complete